MIDDIEQEVARLKAIITELYQSDSMPRYLSRYFKKIG